MPELPGILGYQELGGNKQDYAPVEDIATDRSSNEVNTAFAGIAMMSHTSIKAFVNFTLGTSPAIADGYTAWDAQWKEVTPTLPIVSNIGTGIFTVEFPQVVEDDMQNGVLHTLNLRSVQCSFIGGVRGFISTTFLTPYKLKIELFDVSDTPSDFSNPYTLAVWII